MGFAFIVNVCAFDTRAPEVTVTEIGPTFCFMSGVAARPPVAVQTVLVQVVARVTLPKLITEVPLMYLVPVTVKEPMAVPYVPLVDDRPPGLIVGASPKVAVMVVVVPPDTVCVQVPAPGQAGMLPPLLEVDQPRNVVAVGIAVKVEVWLAA